MTSDENFEILINEELRKKNHSILSVTISFFIRTLYFDNIYTIILSKEIINNQRYNKRNR